MIDKDKRIAELEQEVKELKSALKKAQRYEEAIDAAGFDVWENNFATGEAKGTNVKLFKALGYKDDELPESVDDLLAIVHPIDQEKALEVMQAHFEGKTERYRSELRVKAKNGQWVWMGNYGQVKERNDEGQVTRFIGVNFNIDERRITEETMKTLAYSDELTTLGNRRKLLDVGKNEVEKARRYDRPLAVIFADIDRFKYINDTYGHQKGDQVLKEYAQCIINTLRETDMKFRYGGDEFLVMLPETNVDQAHELALRLNEAVKKMPSHIDMQITTSIGVAGFEEEDSLESLIKKADLALYDAKALGRDSVIVNQI